MISSVSMSQERCSPFIPPWRISQNGKKLKRELHKAHYWLEKKVQERTVDLSKENLVLKKRNNEYKRTIGELHIQLEKLQKSQKKIEQQNIRLKKLDHFKSNFLNVTSHELRTSMATIKGYVEILLMKSLGPITEEQRRGLEVILTNTDSIGSAHPGYS